MERLGLFATTARGTEELLAEELTELGAKKVRQDRGGVRFHANLTEAMNICLWTRIAMRVLYPLGEFEAPGSDGLYEAARNLPWEEHLTDSTTFAIEATLKDTEHAHSGFVALRLKDGLVDRLRDRLGRRPDVDTRNPDFRIVAHLVKQKLSLSLDLCGEALHRRAYRVGSFPAPLKETLAAAMLRSAGYKGEESLFDPMCGSGTLLIEGAMIAMNRAPNLNRIFGIERWPNHAAKVKELLTDLRADAERKQRPAPFPILGRDREEEAIDAAKHNCSAARLGGVVRLEVKDATEPVELNIPPGLLITNPPYGDRLRGGGQKGMKSFYFKLGERFLALQGWRIAVLSGNEAFESAFHAHPLRKRSLFNGPIACELLEYPRRVGVKPA